MFQAGPNSTTGAKIKRLFKVKTSAEEERTVKQFMHNYRYTQAFQSTKQNRAVFQKQLKRPSAFSYKENNHFKSLKRSPLKILSNKVQKNVLASKTKVDCLLTNKTDRHQKINTQINNFTTKMRRISGARKQNIAVETRNGSGNTKHRLVSLSSRKLSNNKSTNSTKTKKLSQSQESRFFYEFSSLKGSKQYNQDSIKTGDGVWIVCDGHGQNGHNVSWYIANILYEIYQQRKTKQNVSKKMMKEIFIQAQNNLEQSGIQILLSGTTCVMVVIEGNRIICASIGDSTAIVIEDDQSYTKISADHKPYNPEEAKRIQFFGGLVKKTKGKEHLPGSPLRLWGQGEDHWGPGLAISRSFGDKMGQKYGLIYEPEVKQMQINNSLRYIALGSDGLFDQITPGQVAKLIRMNSEQNCRANDCKMLTQISQSRWIGYSDDISAIVIYL